MLNQQRTLTTESSKGHKKIYIVTQHNNWRLTLFANTHNHLSPRFEKLKVDTSMPRHLKHTKEVICISLLTSHVCHNIQKAYTFLPSTSQSNKRGDITFLNPGISVNLLWLQSVYLLSTRLKPKATKRRHMMERLKMMFRPKVGDAEQ